MTLLGELIDEARKELQEEDQAQAKEVLKERLREIREAKKVLAQLEEQFEGLLAKDVTDVIS